jgi:hypothetical protein
MTSRQIMVVAQKLHACPEGFVSGIRRRLMVALSLCLCPLPPDTVPSLRHQHRVHPVTLPGRESISHNSLKIFVSNMQPDSMRDADRVMFGSRASIPSTSRPSGFLTSFSCLVPTFATDNRDRLADANPCANLQARPKAFPTGSPPPCRSGADAGLSVCRWGDRQTKLA